VWCTNGQLLYLLTDSILHKADFMRSERSFDQIVQINKDLLLLGEIGKLPYVLKGINYNKSEKSISIRNIRLSPILANKIIFNPKKNEILTFYHTNLIITKTDQPYKSSSIKRVGERIFNIYFNSKNELIFNSKKNYIYHPGTKKEIAELAPFNQRITSDHLVLNDSAELFNIEGDSLFLLYDKRLYNISSEFKQPIDLAIKHLVYKDSTLYIATSRNLYVCKNPLNILQKNLLN
jgi:hypothetical protein